MNIQRKVTESTKKIVVARQGYRCANEPGLKLKRLEDHLCHLWFTKSNFIGVFDEKGYEIDHINELSISGDNSLDNLQALCKSCHRVKTKSFMKELTDLKRKRLVEKKSDNKTDDKNSNDKTETDDDNESDDENKSGDNNESNDKNDSDVKNEFNNKNKSNDKNKSDDNNRSEDENKSDDNNRNNRRQYKCNRCGKIFKYNKNLKYHTDNNSCKEYESECKYCRKQFTSATNMYRHVRSTCNVKKEQDSKKDEIHEKDKICEKDEIHEKDKICEKDEIHEKDKICEKDEIHEIDEIYERLLELEKKTKEIDVWKEKTKHVEKENNVLKKEVISLRKNVKIISTKTTNNNTQNKSTISQCRPKDKTSDPYDISDG